MATRQQGLSRWVPKRSFDGRNDCPRDARCTGSNLTNRFIAGATVIRRRRELVTFVLKVK